MPFYPGAGQAKVIDPNAPLKYFWSNERVSAGQASVAFQLARVKGAYYPWGAAIEITFSATPGTFQVDIQGAEKDQDANYNKLSATSIINAVNGSFVGRYDLGSPLYPKFIRLYTTTFPNDVLITATLTR